MLPNITIKIKVSFFSKIVKELKNRIDFPIISPPSPAVAVYRVLLAPCDILRKKLAHPGTDVRPIAGIHVAVSLARSPARLSSSPLASVAPAYGRTRTRRCARRGQPTGAAIRITLVSVTLVYTKKKGSLNLFKI